MEEYIPGVGIAAGSLQVKWELLNQHIRSKSLKLENGETVNIFINFENVLNNVTMMRNLNSSVNFHKQKLVIELESSILNLISFYRTYFKKEGVNPRIYLYSTSLVSPSQQMTSYNKFYRSYYQNRYMQNPQFKGIGAIINKIIIPEIKLILSYVPGCYFIESRTFDSSIVPMIIASFSKHKNIILSSDVFDTLYLFRPNFTMIYIKRRYSHFNVISTIDAAVDSIIKNENPFGLSIFYSELYYKLLLSIKGSKIRNIHSAKGFGYGRFMNLIKDGLSKDIILRDFESIDSVLQLFPEKYRKDIKIAFQCTDLEVQYDLLGDVDIEEIQSQIIDKIDIASLEALNNKRFLNFPINITGLIG